MNIDQLSHINSSNEDMIDPLDSQDASAGSYVNLLRKCQTADASSRKRSHKSFGIVASVCAVVALASAIGISCFGTSHTLKVSDLLGAATHDITMTRDVVGQNLPSNSNKIDLAEVARIVDAATTLMDNEKIINFQDILQTSFGEIDPLAALSDRSSARASVDGSQIGSAEDDPANVNNPSNENSNVENVPSTPTTSGNENPSVMTEGSSSQDSEVSDGSSDSNTPTIGDVLNAVTPTTPTGVLANGVASAVGGSTMQPQAGKLFNVSHVENQTYTGQPIEPWVVVRSSTGNTLINGIDYTVTYANNIRVHPATGSNAPSVIVTGIGSYAGSTQIVHFAIIGPSLSNAKVSIESAVYNGYPAMPKVTVILNGVTLEENTDYKVSYTNNVNAGIGQATITGIGSYSGMARQTFTIEAGPNGDGTGDGNGTETGDGSGSGTIINPGLTENPNVDKTQEEGSAPLPTEAQKPGDPDVILPGDITIDIDISSVLATSKFITANNFYIDGERGNVQISNGKASVTVDRSKSHIVTAYDYKTAEDRHMSYPTRMYGWLLKPNTDNNTYTATRLYALDDLLIYSGCSIRVTGNKGIRMITSIFDNTKNYLANTGVDGWKMVETGTVIAWADNALNGQVTISTPGVERGVAFQAGVKDPVFGQSHGRSSYTNVMILPDSVSANELKRDIAMRPYIVLQDAEGNQMVVYGGTIYRSVQYIAQQNVNSFDAGTNAYNYIQSILDSCA